MAAKTKKTSANRNIIRTHPKTKLIHCLAGPAIINRNSYREYCINGRVHNINGPARIWENGEKDYYLNGKCYKMFYNEFGKKHQWLLISLKRKLIDKKKY